MEAKAAWVLYSAIIVSLYFYDTLWRKLSEREATHDATGYLPARARQV
jgi:hypothetical protein